jgi:hypothetical protein
MTQDVGQWDWIPTVVSSSLQPSSSRRPRRLVSPDAVAAMVWGTLARTSSSVPRDGTRTDRTPLLLVRLHGTSTEMDTRELLVKPSRRGLDRGQTTS